MFISSILLGVMGEVFISTWRTQLIQEARTQLQQSSRSSVDDLTTTARQAIGVVDSLTVNNVTYTSGANSVVLKLATIDMSGNLTDLNDYIIFRVDPNNAAHLQRLISADPSSSRSTQATPIDLTTELSSLTIQYYDASGVELTPEITPLLTCASVRFTVATTRLVNNQTIVSQLTDLADLRNR